MPGLRSVTGLIPTRLVQALAAAALVLAPLRSAPAPSVAQAAPAAQTASGVCASAVRTIYYDVVAFGTIIPLNGWGDRIVPGLMYTLNNGTALTYEEARAKGEAFPNKAAIRNNPQLAEPLVLRAAVGDCIKVNFNNEILGKRVGMHVDLAYDPKDSDGARVGNNPDTTAPAATVDPTDPSKLVPGKQTYTWFAHREGQFVINDFGSGTNFDLDEPTADTTSVGLYGALIVEPAGSTWHDIRTGQNLLDAANKGVGARVQADVRGPGLADDFRDFVAVFMDEPEEIYDRDGEHPTFPATGLEDSTFGINYRSEPLRNRMRAVMEHRGQVFDPAAGKVVPTAPKTVTLPNGTVIRPEDHFCDGFVPELGKVVDDPGAKCNGEEFHLQSWPFGDPNKLVHKDPTGKIVVDADSAILKAYAADPVRFRLVHPGIKETHTWHQHTNRWRHEPNDPDSTRLDVQSTGPGQTFELRFEGGAGEAVTGTPATVGEQIFHCHLYPHFAQGFWGFVRVFDRLRTGYAWAALDQHYPDGTPIEELQQLPDRAGQTLAPDLTHPGFPLFVKGDFLQKTYRPPYAVTNDPWSTKKSADGVTPFRRPGDTIRTGTSLERASMQGGLSAGQGVKPGTMFIDPCPANIPERTYYPAAIDAKIVYNRAGWHDPNGKLYVEAKPASPDTGDTSFALARADQIRQGINSQQQYTLDDGRAQVPEPYTIRSKLGECVNLRTTNATHLDNDPNWPLDIHGGPEGDVFHESTPLAELTTHVHLVHFDELGTDGTSVGWNYVQGPLIGQTYGYRWFVDVPLRTVYFHDHQHPNTHQQHGLWSAMNVEPTDATWHDPRTGSETNGVGTVADIHTGSGPDFRELTIHYSDFVPQRDAAGQPINPPAEPDDYGADQGVMAVNYRNEPFPIRINSASTGYQAEPAYVFSSVVHGDPSTPIFRAYAGDPVVIRMMDGAHEEEHNFNLAGHRWLHEPDDPKSNLYDTQAMNIAEFFNFEIQGAQAVKVGDREEALEKTREASGLEYGSTKILANGVGGPGDYLYSSQPLNDLWVGMWGILRVPNALVSDLKPLPDRAAPPTGQPWPGIAPGGTIHPPSADEIKDPCPVNAPVRQFSVALVQQKIVYNSFGDNDPDGVGYVLTADLDAYGRPKAGTALKPLFIRANEGDCVVVKFKNLLPAAGSSVHPGDPLNPVENVGVTNRMPDGTLKTVQAVWPAGNRGSIHLSGLVLHDVQSQGGSAVGYNHDTTVGPGQTTTYRYYLDTTAIGIAGFQNLANVRGTRHHGAWGGLIVEPRGAVYLNPTDATPLRSGEAAVIKYPITNPDGTSTTKLFREFVADVQDGLNLHDASGAPIPDQVKGDRPGLPPDPEDQGEKGINYRSERFINRLANGQNIADVFSSAVHGDPATPVFRAYTGDPVMVRVLNSQDLPRTHSFGIFGHEWPHELNDPNSNIINVQGGFNTARAFNLSLVGGAGGVQRASGDYLYGDRNFFHQLSGGIWGLLRVFDPFLDLRPDLLKLDNPVIAKPICPCSVWSDGVKPEIASYPTTTAHELGLRFRSDIDGYVTGIRFYKGSSNTGTHVGHLWTNSGTLLSTVTFANETATGWQQATFPAPVRILPNTTYVASYYAPNGGYAFDDEYFEDSGARNGPVRALADGEDGPNGAYRYGASGFPNDSFEGSNYWVDVVFDTSGVDGVAPTVTKTSPASGATGVALNAVVTATFSEDMKSITFELRDPLGALVAATVTYDAATDTAKLTPSTALKLGTTYTATVKGADLGGNQLAAPVTWSFKTTTDATPPSLTSRSPSAGATGVDPNTNVTATFSEAVSSISFVLKDAAGNTVNSTVTYNSTTRTATLDPTATLASSATYTARVSGAKDAAGNVMTAVSWSFTTAATAPAPTAMATPAATPTLAATPTPTPTATAAPAGCPCSLWSDATKPATESYSDSTANELGVRFRSDVDGYITGIRFYKGPTNTGTHTGSLWTNTGTRLATATFTTETATGWQQVTFATPVAIKANTTYLASYYAPRGGYARDGAYFATTGFRNGPLQALANKVDGANGAYRNGSSGFPDASYALQLANNYWVDVVFTTTAP